MPVGRMEGFDNVGTPRAGTEMCDDTDDDSIKNEYQKARAGKLDGDLEASLALRRTQGHKDKKVAVLKGEAEKRMGALAFRLAYRHKPSFGHLSLTKLSLLIRKEYRMQYHEKLHAERVRSFLRRMKPDLQTVYDTLCKEHALFPWMIKCLKQVYD